MEFPPKCQICGKSMKNGYDSKLKRISEYIWVFDCKCHPKGIRLGIG